VREGEWGNKERDKGVERRKGRGNQGEGGRGVGTGWGDKGRGV